MENKPRASFIIPLRWFTKDKEYLGKNLAKQIKKQIGDSDGLKFITVYAVLLTVRAYEPEKIKITKKFLQKELKPILPNGKLLEIHKSFVQQRSKTVSPTVDFNLFY
jgi:hypothetical protein